MSVTASAAGSVEMVGRSPTGRGAVRRSAAPVLRLTSAGVSPLPSTVTTHGANADPPLVTRIWNTCDPSRTGSFPGSRSPPLVCRNTASRGSLP